MKHKLKIVTNHDYHDCETCGSSYAQGYTAYLDGKKIVDIQALAACYDGTGEVELAGVLAIALEKLGVEIDGEEDDIQYCKNTCYKTTKSQYGIHKEKL